MTMSRTKLDGAAGATGLASGGVILFSLRAQLFQRLGDALQTDFTSENFESAKQRRRGFASTNGDADGLEHLSRLDAEVGGRGAQGLTPVHRG